MFCLINKLKILLTNNYIKVLTFIRGIRQCKVHIAFFFYYKANIRHKSHYSNSKILNVSIKSRYLTNQNYGNIMRVMFKGK